MMITRLLQNRALQKTLTLFGALILCVMSGACLTAGLYQGKKAPLQEQITGFLINPAQQQIVFVGQKHHYIFPLPDDLKQVLMWPGHRMFNTRELDFVISRGNHINGSFSLMVDEGTQLSIEDQQFLLSHGFKAMVAPVSKAHMTTKIKTAEQLFQADQPFGIGHNYIPAPHDDTDERIRNSTLGYSRFEMQGQLHQGTVYEAGKFSLPQMETLQTPLPLTISYDYASTGQVISRVLLTPLSVAADGVSVVVGTVVLLPIYAISMEMHYH